MRSAWIPSHSLWAAAVAAGCGVACGIFVPIQAWKPALAGILVTLSMMGAATLVRLARNAPITAPAAFDESDLKRFFDTLEELSRRLVWLFYQVVLAVIFVIVAMLFIDSIPILGVGLMRIWFGIMAALLVWLVSRLVVMAQGDIGFLRLQREILQNALARERKKQAEKAIVAPVQFRSPGSYGQAV